MWKNKSIGTQIKNTFKQFDIDGDGTISFQELSRVLNECGQIAESEVLYVFNSMDVDKDGGIKYDEFVDWVMEAQPDGGGSVEDVIEHAHASSQPTSPAGDVPVAFTNIANMLSDTRLSIKKARVIMKEFPQNMSSQPELCAEIFTMMPPGRRRFQILQAFGDEFGTERRAALECILAAREQFGPPVYDGKRFFQILEPHAGEGFQLVYFLGRGDLINEQTCSRVETCGGNYVTGRSLISPRVFEELMRKFGLQQGVCDAGYRGQLYGTKGSGQKFWIQSTSPAWYASEQLGLYRVHWDS